MLTPLPAFLASLLMLATTACSSLHVDSLPTFQACRDLPPATGEPRCEWADKVDVKALPTLVPYAYATVIARERSKAGDSLRRTCEGVDPDLILMRESDSDTGMTLITHAGGVGGGPQDAEPNHRRPFQATCYRLAPVKLGLRWDELGLVQQVDESARASGISIGDQITTFADVPVDYGSRQATSPHWMRLLELKPGDRIILVWNRPKVGRMQGGMTCQPNPPVGL